MKKKLIKGKTVHIDTETCSKCDGDCCKHYPGIYHPKDLSPELEKNVLTGLLKKEMSVDWWDGVLKGKVDRIFVRPSIDYSKGPFPKDFEPDLIQDPTFGGHCSFFREGEGCKLSPEKRPKQCRLLKPKTSDSGKCVSTGPKKKALALAWSPFESIVTESVDLAYKTRKAAREKKGRSRRTVLRAVVKKLR